ncbi:MAG: hypothetical protein V2A58_05065 [Planctomycetota bacterium]
MLAIVFVVVLLAGFLTSLSIGVIYLKPACPKCGSRAAVAYKKRKGKRRPDKNSYTCEGCDHDFQLRGKVPVHINAWLLLGAGLLCLATFLTNHVYSMLQEDRSLAALRANDELRALIPKARSPQDSAEPLDGDFRLAVFQRTTPRALVKTFLDSHPQAKEIPSSQGELAYVFYYGWLPSHHLTVTFDQQGRYRDQVTRYW